MERFSWAVLCVLSITPLWGWRVLGWPLFPSQAGWIGTILWVAVVGLCVVTTLKGLGLMRHRVEFLSKHLAERLQGKVAPLRQGPYYGDMFAVEVEKFPSGEIKICWEWDRHLPFLRKYPAPQKRRLVGFRKEGAAFDELLGAEGHGIQVVDSTEDGNRDEKDLKPGEYFYVFFVKSGDAAPGGKNAQLLDRVPFSLKVPQMERAVQPKEPKKPQKSKEEMDWENFEESLKTLEREIKKDLHLLVEEDRIIAELQQSKNYEKATPKRRKQMIEAVRQKFEQARLDRESE